MLHHFARLQPSSTNTIIQRQEFFRHLVPASTPTDRILLEVVGHPFHAMAHVFSSLYNFVPTFNLLFSAGFLPFLAPWAMIPSVVVDLPHLLASNGRPPLILGAIPNNAGFWNFGLHYGAAVWGPLLGHRLWNRNAYRRLLPGKRQGWLLVWALFISGFGFRFANRVLLRDWRPSFDAIPHLATQIPPNAPIWAYEFALPPYPTAVGLR